VAFLRRKGNAYYLVHNIREGGKIKQLHLARLGERPRITDDVVRQVNRTHPQLALDWRKLREQINNRAEIPDAGSVHVQRLLSTLRTLNLDLADLFPPVLNLSQSRGIASEIVTQLRLLQSTVGAKLDQFNDAHFRIRSRQRSFR
jgi:hypothetical protein